MDPSQLERLPTELVQETLYSTSPEDIIAFCRASKKYASICYNEGFWQEKARRDFGLPLPSSSPYLRYLQLARKSRDLKQGDQALGFIFPRVYYWLYLHADEPLLEKIDFWYDHPSDFIQGWFVENELYDLEKALDQGDPQRQQETIDTFLHNVEAGPPKIWWGNVDKLRANLAGYHVPPRFLDKVLSLRYRDNPETFLAAAELLWEIHNPDEWYEEGERKYEEFIQRFPEFA